MAHIDNGSKGPVHVQFYSLERYGEESSFKNVCPVCGDGILMGTLDSSTMELLARDSCTLCGQRFVYDDIDLVRSRHGW